MSDVTLKEHFEVLVREKWAVLESRLDAMDQAIVLAKEAIERSEARNHKELDRRLDELNQLRRSVETDRNVFVRDDVNRPWHDAVNAKLTALETRSLVWTSAIGALFVLVNIALRLMGK